MNSSLPSMSKSEHIGFSPSQVSCHANGYSCPKQHMPGQTHEFSAGCKDKDSGLLEQKHQPGTEYMQVEPGDTINTTLQGHVNETLKPASEVLTGNLFTKDLDASPEDSSGHSLTNQTLIFKPAVVDKKFKSGSRSEDAKLDDVCEPSGASKERDPFASLIVENKLTGTICAPSSGIVKETLQSVPVDVAESSVAQYSGVSHEGPIDSHVDKSSHSQELTLGQMLEFPSNGSGQETSEQNQKSGFGPVENEPVVPNPRLSNSAAADCLELAPEFMGKSSRILCNPEINVGQLFNVEIGISTNGRLIVTDACIDKQSNAKQLKTPSNNSRRSSTPLGNRVKRTTTRSRKKYKLRSKVASNRVLRSRSQQKMKEPETSNAPTYISATKERKRKKGKRKSRKDVTADEYSRIRTHLRYLMNRMNYETSLITAYSAEGWKGLSLEKLKPEMELQRATSEILRLKLRVRDLFQQIDSLCAAGRLPESLFDSEGQISSEDIFCAKCGSKDLTLDNDIILCDGACDRGFHQFCLVPPLRKEDIPPDDEGWLCPGCDCKVDCIDLLNESQGTNLSISNGWEKVFPEAAAASAGNLDQNFRLPSDDSDDNDYNPGGPDTDEESHGDESSSDESDFTSASDELVGPSHDKQRMGLPSDDSGDNDYDPDAPDVEEEVKQESSSSDFSSDSEDLAAIINDNELSGEDERPTSIGPHEDVNSGRSKICRTENAALYGELLSILEQDPSEDGSTPVSGKRNVERLDYKRLYDETYGNDNYNSSEDEEYTDATGPRKRKKMCGRTVFSSGNGNAPQTENGLGTNDVKQQLKDTRHSLKGNYETPKVEDTNITPARAQECSLSSSGGRTIKSSTYKRLGEAVTQRLYQSFKENQYPDRAMKESLAQELGITFNQVNKWFGNARWSFNHSQSMDASAAKSRLEKDSTMTNTVNRPLDLATDTFSRDADHSGAQFGDSPRESGANPQESSKQISNTPESRGAKQDLVDQRTGLVCGLPATQITTRKYVS